MAETKLDGLRLEATLDASGYERGAQAIAKGSKDIETSVAGAGVAVTQTEQKVVQSASAFDRLQRQLDPAAKATADFERAQRTLDRALETGRVTAQQHAQMMGTLQQRYQAAGQAAVAFGTGAVTAGGGVGRIGQAAGQAGFQLQDFAGQVSAGTSALTAMGQQLPQFLGVFGTGGAIAGAAVAVGVLAAKLFETGDASKEMGKAIEAGEKSFADAMKAADAYAKGLDAHIAGLQRLATYYQSVTNEVRELAAAQINQQRGEAQRANTRRRGDITGSDLVTPRDLVPSGGVDVFGSATGYADLNVTVAAADPSREQFNAAIREFRDYRGSDPVQALAEFRKKADEIGRSNTVAGEAAREAAKRAMEALPEMKRFAESMKEFGEHEQAIYNQIIPLPPENAPEPPTGKRTGAASKALREREQEMKRLKADAEQLQKSFDDFWDKAEDRSEKRAGQESVKSWDKAQKEITDLQKKEEQKRESIARDATDSVVRYSADAFADMFDGNTNGWKKMLSGFFDLTKQIMARIVAEMVLRPVIEPIMSSVFGGVGGSSIFGAAGTSAAGFLAAPLIGGVSGGRMLGAGMLGFGAGMMANSVAGGNQRGGMIGSGVGALGGAALGSMVGMPIMGALAGGLGGGLLGGLFGGGGKSRPMSGDVIININGAGLAEVGNVSGRGRGWDSAAARAAAQQQADSLNASLSQRGLSFGGGGALATIGSGASKNPTDLLTGVAGALDRLTSSSASVQTAIDNTARAGGNLATVLANVDWVQQVYDPMLKASQGTNEFERSLNAIRSQFEPVITRASQLGLATGDLSAAMARAIEDMVRQRDHAMNSFGWNMELRSMKAGLPEGADDYHVAMKSYNIQAAQERFQLEGQLGQWGAAIEQANAMRATMEQVHNDERLRIQYNYQERDARAAQRHADDMARQQEAAAAEQQRIQEAAAAEQQRLQEAAAAAAIRIQEFVLSQTRSMEVRSLRAGMTVGVDDYTSTMQMFNLQANHERDQLERQLHQMNVSAEQAHELRIQMETVHNDERLRIDATYLAKDQAIRDRAAEENLRELERVQNEERRIREEHEQRRQSAAGQAQGVVANLADYVLGKRMSDDAPGSLQSRYAGMRQEFENVVTRAGTGDANAWGRVQGNADMLLDLSRQLYGSGAQYAADFNEVMRRLGDLGSVGEDTLTGMFFAQETRLQTSTLAAELQQLRAAVTRVSLELAQTTSIPARAA